MFPFATGASHRLFLLFFVYAWLSENALRRYSAGVKVSDCATEKAPKGPHGSESSETSQLRLGPEGGEPSSRRAHMATLSSTSSCSPVHGEPVLILRGD